MAGTIQYFLGANTPKGFICLYPELIHPEQARAIYILKGGPGCGKSTLMRQVAARAEQEGLAVQSVLCSGDPDSLDALLLPEKQVAVFDGTAPHPLEARYPGAVERYVNLGECYDSTGLYAVRADIMGCKALCRDRYRKACRYLEAAGTLLEDARSPMTDPECTRQLTRRAAGILRRELPARRGSAPGRVTQRFLSTPTHKGVLLLWETARNQCGHIYQLVDGTGLGHELLLRLLAGAVERGYSPVACPDPMAPNRLTHLLIPEAGVAFLTSTRPLPEKPYRRLRVDALADKYTDRSVRAELRFSRRMSEELVGEAVEALAQTKAAHDQLEAIYRPYVDFQRVQEMTEQVTDEIFSLT